VNVRLLVLAAGVLVTGRANRLPGQTPLEVVRSAVSRALNRTSLAAHSCAAPYFANCEGGIELVTQPTIRVLTESPDSARLEVSCILVARIASTEADMLVLDAPAGTRLVDTLTVRRANKPAAAWVVPAWPRNISGNGALGVRVRTTVSTAQLYFQLAPAHRAHLDALAARIQP